MKKFKFTPLAIPDVILIEPTVFEDERGWLMEAWNKEEFAEAGIDVSFVQTNVSYSKKGVLRGLHYQAPPYEQGKLVHVLQGEIFDVAVDIREDSPTRGQWVAEYLNDKNKKMLWIPPGFAHGFYVTSERALVAYQLDQKHWHSHERALLWSDPELGIPWPLSDNPPQLSEKDRTAPPLVPC